MQSLQEHNVRTAHGIVAKLKNNNHIVWNNSFYLHNISKEHTLTLNVLESRSRLSELVKKKNLVQQWRKIAQNVMNNPKEKRISFTLLFTLFCNLNVFLALLIPHNLSFTSNNHSICLFVCPKFQIKCEQKQK